MGRVAEIAVVLFAIAAWVWALDLISQEFAPVLSPLKFLCSLLILP